MELIYGLKKVQSPYTDISKHATRHSAYRAINVVKRGLKEEVKIITDFLRISMGKSVNPAFIGNFWP